jgi:hypothetical protein
MTSEPDKENIGVQEPSDSNTFERRLEFLVGQVRGLYETTSTLQSSLHSLEMSTAQSVQQLTDSSSHASKLSASLLTIRGECVADAPQFEDVGGMAGSAIEPLAKGTTLVLAYPMVREQGAVLMRRMNVNRHTAAISWTWVVLYHCEPNDETVFVSQFSC